MYSGTLVREGELGCLAARTFTPIGSASIVRSYRRFARVTISQGSGVTVRVDAGKGRNRGTNDRAGCEIFKMPEREPRVKI